MDDQCSVLLRVWLPDRPGVLGAVGTRIGGVKGDLVGIDILERGAGCAVDELVVSVPSLGVVDLMVREINEIEGVEVESCLPLDDPSFDPRLDALVTAAALVSAGSIMEIADLLCRHGRHSIRADWAVLVDAEGNPVASDGDTPEAEWLRAYASGSRAAGLSRAADPMQGLDTISTSLPAVGGELLLGRRAATFHPKERARATALTSVADGAAASVLRASGWAAASHEAAPFDGAVSSG